MKQRAFKVIRNALIILVIGALYAVFVKLTGLSIPCIIRKLTGFMCPGCGTTGMCLALLRLDFKAAFEYNEAVFCMLPFLAFVIGRLIYLYIRYDRRQDKATNIMCYVMIGILVIWGVLRNIVKI